jgi:hypothetical protein
MARFNYKFHSLLILIGCVVFWMAVPPAASQDESNERTSLNILVTDAETGQPISQARLTLQFRDPRKHRLDAKLSFNAKTNPQGRYKFLRIPKGTVHLIVTAEHRQSFGRDIEIERDNQLVEVRLKRPQPLL